MRDEYEGLCIRALYIEACHACSMYCFGTHVWCMISSIQGYFSGEQRKGSDLSLFLFICL